jgi:hypothetical protein
MLVTKSSFYADGNTYDEAVVVDNDTTPPQGNSKAPSSFYPNGTAYAALQDSDSVLADMTALKVATEAAAARGEAAESVVDASADAAAASAAAALVSENHAATSETNASTSATNAANSSTSAAGSASTATTQAGIATTKASNAATSATNASTSEANALASKNAAATSATNAATSETNALASKNAAAISETNAATSATNAASAVQAAAGTATPLVDGTAAVGTGVKWAREDHRHPVDTSRAPLNSPGLTGVPTAPTASLGTNTTQIATTAFVLANAPSAQNTYGPPQGRLTLASGVSYMTSSQAAATILYYTPGVGDLVPIFDGTTISMVAFPEVSQANSDATKSPGSVATNTCYDLFAWMDGSTPRVTRGPAWTNVITPSAGAALTSYKGLQFNSVAITNGPAAMRGTYVGTVCTNGTATYDFIFGAASAGGTPARFALYNAYNQLPISTTVTDTAGGYGYTSTTVRQAGGSAGNQIAFLVGRGGTVVHFDRAGTVRALATGAYTQFGVGFDLINAYGVSQCWYQSPSGISFNGAVNSGLWNVGVGMHTLTSLEGGDGTTANTFNAAGRDYLSALLFL